MAQDDQRAGAEIVHGAEECYDRSQKLLGDIGFPRGFLPLKNLQEWGFVHETGYLWMKQKDPYDHFYANTNTLVRFETEVTSYVENGKMKKMSGVKSKQLLLWVPTVEMSIQGTNRDKIYFKSAMGIGKSFPLAAFVV